MGAEPIGVDVAQAAIDRARAGHPDLDFRLAPIDGPLPFDDVSFDVVWTSEVIEHVADTARWLSEVRRVLVPRGRLLLTTPSHGRLRVAVGGIEAFSDPLGDHLHLYTQARSKTCSPSSGLTRSVSGPPAGRLFCGGCCSRVLCVERGLRLGDQGVGLGSGGAEGHGSSEFGERGLRRVEAQVELSELQERLRASGLAGGSFGQSGASGGQVVQGDVRR